jgi:hypothetical protein
MLKRSWHFLYYVMGLSHLSYFTITNDFVFTVTYSEQGGDARRLGTEYRLRWCMVSCPTPAVLSLRGWREWTDTGTYSFAQLLLLLLWLYSHLLGLGRFFSFLTIHTVGRTTWTGDQPVERPLPTHRTTQTQNKRTKYRHPRLEWDWNTRFQRSSERK